MSGRGQGGIGISGGRSPKVDRCPASTLWDHDRIDMLQRVSAVGLNSSYLHVEPRWFMHGKFPFPSSVEGHSRVWLSVWVFTPGNHHNLVLTPSERYKSFKSRQRVTLVNTHYLNIKDRPSLWQSRLVITWLKFTHVSHELLIIHSLVILLKLNK